MDKNSPKSVIVKGNGSVVPLPEPKRKTGLRTAGDLVAFKRTHKAYKEAQAQAQAETK